MRKRIGYRRHRATFERYDGTRDSYGQLDTKNSNNWDTVALNWPCEYVSTVGGEILRGIMVTDKSTHVIYGNFAYVEGITVEDRVTVNGVLHGINAVLDPDGTRTEMRIELRKEK